MGKKCVLCRSSAVDEMNLGPIHSRSDIAVHQNCLYLSSALVQRGHGQNTILDFSLKDIRAEAQRTNRMICCYCSNVGANIGCCHKYCRNTFHTYCGIKYCAQNQYVGTYKSFCNKHIVPYKSRPADDEECSICFDRLIPKGKSFCFTRYIYGKCCGHGWYHKSCLQSYANSSGYFFKCPLCNDTTAFFSVKKWGICVPDRDAAWEEGDAYADQLQVSQECTAANCLSPEGRMASSVLALHFCDFCGSNPVHPQCINGVDYSCNDCCINRTNIESDDEMNNSLDDEEDPLYNIDILLAKSSRQTIETTAVQTTAAFAFTDKENLGSIASPKRGRIIEPLRRNLEIPQPNREKEKEADRDQQDGEPEQESEQTKEEKDNGKKAKNELRNMQPRVILNRCQPRVILSRRHTCIYTPLQTLTNTENPSSLGPQRKRRSQSVASQISPFDISCVANRTRARRSLKHI